MFKIDNKKQDKQLKKAKVIASGKGSVGNWVKRNLKIKEENHTITNLSFLTEIAVFPNVLG